MNDAMLYKLALEKILRECEHGEALRIPYEIAEEALNNATGCTPSEVLADTLIRTYTNKTGEPISFAKACVITAVCTKMPAEELARLLALDDEGS